jgi:hypothetical protein
MKNGATDYRSRSTQQRISASGAPLETGQLGFVAQEFIPALQDALASVKRAVVIGEV